MVQSAHRTTLWRIDASALIAVLPHEHPVARDLRDSPIGPRAGLPASWVLFARENLA